MAKIIVALFNTQGHRLEYKSFEQSEINIGRAFHNDVIVTDPFVSPHHCQLTRAEKGWVLIDCGSENGVYIRKTLERFEERCVESGDEFIIGESRLCVYFEDHPLAPTKVCQAPTPNSKTLSRPFMIGFLLLLVFWIYTIDAHLVSIKNLSFVKKSLTGVGALIGILIWAGGWAFIGQLIKHRARFMEQISVASIFTILSLPLKQVSTYLGFRFSSMALEGLCSSLFFGIVFAWLLIRNLSLSTRLSLKKQRVATAFITIAIMSIGALSYFADTAEFRSSPSYFGTLKAPYIPPPRGGSIDAFMKEGTSIYSFENHK